MPAKSLPHSAESPQTYTVKELQMTVRDAPVVPAEIAPFVGATSVGSKQVHQLFKGMAALPVESFVALHLNAKNRIVGMTTCSIGSMTGAMAHPRDVFRPAIANLTAGVLFVHNHPSGDPTPSQDDIQLTRRLVEAGRIIGIPVLDHVIITAGGHFSFCDHGMI